MISLRGPHEGDESSERRSKPLLEVGFRIVDSVLQLA